MHKIDEDKSLCWLRPSRAQFRGARNPRKPITRTKTADKIIAER